MCLLYAKTPQLRLFEVGQGHQGGVENILHFDPRKLGVSHQTSTRASGVDRTCDLSSSPTSPEFASSEGTTSQAFRSETMVAADPQLPCVISETSTEGSVASQVPTSQLKEHLSPSVQLSLHHFTPEVVQILLQIPGFRNGVVNIFHYVASQVQASAWVNSSIRMSSFVGEFGPEDLSTQLAAFIMLTPGVLYEQMDMTCRDSNLAL